MYRGGVERGAEINQLLFHKKHFLSLSLSPLIDNLNVDFFALLFCFFYALPSITAKAASVRAALSIMIPS
jgi:hypothetical protein